MIEAFIDESSLRHGNYFFLVVVAVVTTNPRKIELDVRKLKRVPKLRVRSELKAAASSSETAKKFLRLLANDPGIRIVAVMWNGQRNLVDDYEELYQRVVARCAFHTVRQTPRIDLHIDKRYTNKHSQRNLEEKVRKAIAVVPKNIVRVFQEDSQKVKPLGAADFIAWAYLQRYCRANSEFYNLIKSKVVHFDNLSE
jgi:hypothetical protein